MYPCCVEPVFENITFPPSSIVTVELVSGSIVTSELLANADGVVATIPDIIANNMKNETALDFNE